MEILVLHPGALGDLVLSLPALRLLKRHHAGARVTLAANLDYLTIVPKTCADRFLSLSTVPLQRLYGSEALPESDRRFWTSFDRILSWTGSANDQFIGNLQAVHRQALVAAWRPLRDEARHVSRIFADSLYPWVPRQKCLRPVRISTKPTQSGAAKKWLSEHGCPPGTDIIALHPGGGGIAKRWPFEHFVQLSRALEQTGDECLLVIEGPAEPGLGRKLAETLPASRSLVAGGLPLEHLAAILSHCRAYVGSDSGISHLAAALGVFCVVLFGPTSPVQWAPIGRKVKVLREAAGCASCENERSEGHECLENVSSEHVLNLLRLP